MPPPSLTYLLDNVGTSTVEHRLDGLIDQFFDSNPLAARLLQQDRITVEGGRDIRQRIIYTNKPGGSYRGLDPFDTSQKESRTEMRFDWKQYYINITVDGLSLLQNSGPEQIADLVSDEMDEAEISGPDYIGTDVFGDGTGNGGKAITGLRAALDDGTTYGTYGGITRSSTTGTAGYAVRGNVNTTAVSFSLPQTNTYFQQATIGKQKPNLIITTQALWNKFWERSQPAQRFSAGSTSNNMASIGFDTVVFNGADVVEDSHCPSSHIYFLNTNWLKMVVHSKRMWTPTGWKYPTNQDAAIQQLLWAGELVCRSPRLQSLATSVT
jgi:hypothetical protein